MKGCQRNGTIVLYFFGCILKVFCVLLAGGVLIIGETVFFCFFIYRSVEQTEQAMSNTARFFLGEKMESFFLIGLIFFIVCSLLRELVQILLKNAPIDVRVIEKKANSASYFTDNTIYCENATENYCRTFFGTGEGEYGYVNYYMPNNGYYEYQWYLARNGITLYYCLGTSVDMTEVSVPTPENYDGMIQSGQRIGVGPTCRDSKGVACLAIKIVAYKKGKPVMFYSRSIPLSAGTIGKRVIVE